jgi:hypothetical protein
MVPSQWRQKALNPPAKNGLASSPISKISTGGVFFSESEKPSGAKALLLHVLLLMQV